MEIMQWQTETCLCVWYDLVPPSFYHGWLDFYLSWFHLCILLCGGVNPTNISNIFVTQYPIKMTSE